MNRTKQPPMLDFPDVPRQVLEDAALSQLKRLLRYRQVLAPELKDAGIRLLDVSIMAAIEDARAAGASDKVRSIIRAAERAR